MLVGCLMAFTIDSLPNKPMGKATHHQMTHNGELLIALAFAFPHAQLSDSTMRVAFVALQLGTWSNCLAYWLLAITNSPNPIFLKSGLTPPGQDTIFTTFSTLLLFGPTVLGMLISLVLLAVGVFNCDVDPNNTNKRA